MADEIDTAVPAECIADIIKRAIGDGVILTGGVPDAVVGGPAPA